MLADLLTALVSDHIQTDRFLAQEDAQTLMAIYWKYIRARPATGKAHWPFCNSRPGPTLKAHVFGVCWMRQQENKRPRSLLSRINPG